MKFPSTKNYFAEEGAAAARPLPYVPTDNEMTIKDPNSGFYTGINYKKYESSELEVRDLKIFRPRAWRIKTSAAHALFTQK